MRLVAPGLRFPKSPRHLFPLPGWTEVVGDAETRAIVPLPVARVDGGLNSSPRKLPEVKARACKSPRPPKLRAKQLPRQAAQLFR